MAKKKKKKRNPKDSFTAHVKKQEFAGLWFASKLEKRVYKQLLVLEEAGEIRDIRLQPILYLTAARFRYTPDFVAFHIPTECDRYYEAKGFDKDVQWKHTKRRWESGYGPKGAVLEIWISAGGDRVKMFKSISGRGDNCPECGVNIAEILENLKSMIQAVEGFDDNRGNETVGLAEAKAVYEGFLPPEPEGH